MARNKKVEILSNDKEVLHPMTDGDCVIFEDGQTLAQKLSEDDSVKYTPEIVNSSPMFKVGEGNTVDYSDNVLDGAYERATLQGQTYVNYIQESSADEVTLPTPFTEYERTQHNTLTSDEEGTLGINLIGQSYVNALQHDSEEEYVVLGESLEFQEKKVEYTNEGQIKSAMLNGQTLVNLVEGSYKSQNTHMTKIGNEYKIYKHPNYTGYPSNRIKLNNIEHGKTYTLIFDYKATMEITGYVGFSVDDGSASWNVRTHTLNMTTSYQKAKLLVQASKSEYNWLSFTNGLNSWSEDYDNLEIYLKNIVVLEGDHTQEDIPYFQGMQSVTMTTQLENVCSRYNSSAAKNGKTFTVGTSNDRRMILSDSSNIAKYGFKQNMKYLMQFKITNLNLDGEEYIELIFSDDNVSSGNALFGDYASTSVKITKNGIYRTVLTTSTVIDTSIFVIKGISNQWENSTSTTRRLTISQIMCIEYQNGMENWDLPYFETTQLMKPLKVRSISKNLFDTANLFSSYKTTISEVTTNSFTLTGTDSNATYKNTLFLFDVKPNTDYKITFKSEATDGDSLCDVYDANAKYLGSRNFNSGNNTRVCVRFYVNTNNTKNGTVKYYDIQMEESLTETPYVPHQSKTTSALEPITLRAIGDVKDTLDLSTGEYVQRIGEVVFDGSENWGASDVISKRYSLDLYATMNAVIDKTKILCICDKIQSITTNQSDDDKMLGITITNGNRVMINTNYDTINEFKDWLSQNPIKVQYELANPITRKISLEYPNLQTYTDITHVQSIAMDGTLIPNIFLPSDISYKAMLKPNTSYNVIVDRQVIDSTNQLTVNLGGTTANITANRTVVTTPSTLSNETLTFSGKDNRIAKAMLIEGNTLINGDLPHFNGIGDVKLGRVVENLCMSNESYAGSFGGNATVTQYQDKLICKLDTQGSLVTYFPLTKQLQNGKKYFIYSPSSSSLGNEYVFYGFRQDYNGSSSFAKQTTNFVNGKYSIITPMQEGNEYTHITIGNHGKQNVGTTYSIRRPILCEYIDGMENWDWESIGYFTGTKNVGNEFMRIGNKNLFSLNKDDFVQGSRLKENNLQVTSSSIRITSKNMKSFKCKPNTSYTITLSDANYDLGIYTIDDSETLLQDLGWFSQRSNKTFTTNEKAKYFVFHCRKTDNSTITLDDYNYSSIQLEEASSATSYVAHKHNSLHILPDKQIPLTFEQGRIDYTNNGTWANAINNTSTQVIRTQLLDLEPNETYRVSCGRSDFMFAVGLYNNSLLGSSVISYTSDRERYITTTKDVHKIGIATTRKDSANITPSVLHQVRLEKVTDVTLKGFGGVRDELDLTRGVYIQRIGEIVLDGSEKWNLCTLAYQPTDTNYINYDLDIDNIKLSAPILCDSIKTRDWNISSMEFNSRSIAGHSTNRILRLCIEKTIASDVETLKTYLSTNMVKVQYQLRTPIEHKINIPMKNESNQTIAKPNGVFTLPLMYSETNHVDINSQIYPKVESRDYISYPVIANDSQLHTVFHNKVGTGNLTVNLCGTSVTSVDGTSKCTITTPSTISQYELRLSGARNKVSNVCVFSGDYMNVNVPYVEGMMNAVNPIVKNVGKNLFDGVVKNGEGWWDGKTHILARCRRSVNLTPVKPNTEYIFKLTNRYGIGCGANFMAHGKDGKFLKYIGWVLSDTSKFTTPSDCYYIHWYNDIDDFTDFYIEESSTPSQYEPYKENICYVDCGEIRLTPDMFEQGTVSGANGIGTKYEVMKENSTVRLRSKDIIRVKPNTSYRLSRENGYTGWCVPYDSNKGYLGKTYDTEVFTTDSQTCYIVPVLRNISGTTMTLDKVEKFRLVEVDKTITLRSLPNGVRDELNLQTGEYIQRIGEVVFDGSDDEVMWLNSGWMNGDYVACYWDVSRMGLPNKKCGISNMICETFVTILHPIVQDGGIVTRERIWGETGSGVIYISVKKTKLPELNTNGFRQWASQNPITVQYQLAKPIVKQIDINNFPHSYKDGHVIIESNDPSTNVTAQMTYQCVANRTGQIQEHTEQVEKQEHEINELEMLILENIRQQQNR